MPMTRVGAEMVVSMVVLTGIILGIMGIISVDVLVAVSVCVTRRVCIGAVGLAAVELSLLPGQHSVSWGS
jgi:hypothetical protein